MGPFNSLTFYGGIEGEKLDKSGDTDAVLLKTLPGVGIVSPDALIASDQDKWGLEENFGVRYTAVPKTTVYAEGKWVQQDIDLMERDLEDGELAIQWDTDTWVTHQKYSVGLILPQCRERLFPVATGNNIAQTTTTMWWIIRLAHTLPWRQQ